MRFQVSNGVSRLILFPSYVSNLIITGELIASYKKKFRRPLNNFLRFRLSSILSLTRIHLSDIFRQAVFGRSI